MPLSDGFKPLLCFAEQRRLDQCEKHHFFAPRGADDMVQAQYPGAGNLLDHRFQDRPRRFHQLHAYLFQEIPTFRGLERLDQMLFCRRQNPLEPDHEQITNLGKVVANFPHKRSGDLADHDDLEEPFETGRFLVSDF